MNNTKNETFLNNTFLNNITNPFYINITIQHSKKIYIFQKLAYYFLLLLLTFFILFFIFILVLLIRKQIRRIFEKMRRIKLQKEINKIMNLDIFETRSPNLDTNSGGFNPVSNDSSLGEITSSNNILSEINAKNTERELKKSTDS